MLIQTQAHRNILVSIITAIVLTISANNMAGPGHLHQTPTASTAELRYIFLIRHAEKQKGKDPALSPAGQRRAENYAEFFSQLPIDKIYASKYKRNQQTVAPIAARLKLKIGAFDPFKQAEFAKQLTGESGNILVVGHNNLTEIIAALGGKVDSKIDHSDYRRVYQLILRGTEVVDTLRFQAY